MAELNPPTWLQAGTYPARLDRLMLAALTTPDPGTGALAARGGVRPAPATALQVTQRTTPTMGVTVAAGMAVVPAPSATGGCYVVVADSATNLNIGTAHASLARRDLVCARVRDSEFSGVTNAWSLEVIAGTPAGSPVLPATPSGAIPLAQVQVNAAATTITNSNITDLRTFTVPLGGVLPVLTTGRPATPYKGQAIYETNTNRPAWWNGSGWHSWDDEGYLTASDVATLLAAFTPKYAADEGGQRTINTSGSWLDYSSAPSVSVTVPSSGRVMAIWGFNGWNNNTQQSTIRVVPVASGANLISPSIDASACVAGPVGTGSSDPGSTATRTKLWTGLAPGNTTFKLQARISSGNNTTHSINDSFLYVAPVF